MRHLTWLLAAAVLIFGNGQAKAGHAYLYNAGTYTLSDVPGSTATVPTGISGDNVVGTYQLSSTGGTTYGYLYNGTSSTPPVAPPGAAFTWATGISQ